MKRCRRHGRRFCRTCTFTAVQLALFPLEHWPWDHVYPLTVLARAMGVG